MRAADLKKICLDLPGAGEEFPFDDLNSVFKVAGKVFAISRLTGEPLRVSLKCDPDLAVKLRIQYPAITAGYHLNKKHWNTVVLDDSVSDELVREMIEDSYDLVVSKLSKARQERLHWVGLAARG